MNSVDNVDLPVSAGVACDHVGAKSMWVRGSKPTMVIAAPRVHIVIEEGLVKVLCGDCFIKAIQTPLW